MKSRRGSSLTLAVLLFVSTARIADAQSYTAPRKLALDGAVRREFQEWFPRSAQYPVMIPEQIFPIGWSMDGKFAYYVEPVDEACGCYYAKLVIQDMRTDKKLWEFKYDQSNETDPKTGDMKGPGDLRRLWRRNVKAFSDKLRQHKIVAGRSVLLGKTFTSDGRPYTAKALIKMGKNPDNEGARVDKLSFLLTSPNLGTKTLYSVDHSKEEYWFTLDAGVIGVIKSPYEKRVAVIGMEVNRGWEGPPHTGDIIIVGADLTSGFGVK